MKEKLLETFKALGFEMENLDDTAYSFQYEGKNFLFLSSKDDDFINIALPCIVKVKDVGQRVFDEIMKDINATLKYVKAYYAFGGMTLFYEREIIGDEDLEAVLRSMIQHLDADLYYFSKKMDSADDDNSDNSDDIDSNDNDDDDDGIGFDEATEIEDDEEKEK